MIANFTVVILCVVCMHVCVSVCLSITKLLMVSQHMICVDFSENALFTSAVTFPELAIA